VGATEAAVLGLLTAGRLSGYDLEKRVRTSVGYFWAPARSQLYALLPRLVAAGLVARDELVQGRGPAKQLYRITPAGRGALELWLEEGSIGPEPDRNVLLLKVFFGHLMRPERLLEQVRERRREAEQLKGELEEIEARSTSGETETFAALTRRYGFEWAEAVCRWADHAERELAGVGDA
jgi:DNA-binding PadR family transcriptional regulator